MIFALKINFGRAKGFYPAMLIVFLIMRPVLLGSFNVRFILSNMILYNGENWLHNIRMLGNITSNHAGSII